MADPEDIAEARRVLARAGFAVEELTDEEVEAKAVATMQALTQIGKALSSVWVDLGDRLAPAFDRLARLAHEVEAMERKDGAA